jgi:amino acid permease
LGAFGIDHSSESFLLSWKFRALQGVPTAALVLFPMSLIKDMSGFRYISFASIFALLYTGIVLICEMKSYIDAYKPGAKIEPVIFNLNFFKASCLTFFAYTCQVQLLPIYSELINPQKRRIFKVIIISVLVDVSFYLSIAAFGYFSTFDKTPSIVLNRPPLNEGKVDYAILIAQLSILLVLFVAVPVNYNPFRNQVFYMYYKKEGFSMNQ